MRKTARSRAKRRGAETLKGVLIPHPALPCAAVRRLEAKVARSDESIDFVWTVSGNIGALAAPAPAAPARKDGLWRHTCFEAFLQDGDGYVELNVSPSGEWAAYRFDGYRTGMTPAELAQPHVQVRAGRDVLEVSARFVLAATGRLGLAAVIEEAGGRISYWALAHGGAKPDFHDRGTFVIDLASERRP